MNALYSLSMALWQTPDGGLPSRDEHWLLICIAVIAAAMILQGFATIVASLAARKTLLELKELAADLHAKATPIMHQTSELMRDVAPKVRSITENANQISYTVRASVDEAGETLRQVNRTVVEANIRSRAQVDHVDRIVSSALETSEEVVHTVATGIRIPLRQVAGMIAGLRVGIDTLMKNFTPKGGNGPE